MSLYFSKQLYRILKFVIGLWIRRRFRIRVENPDAIPAKPPYLVLPNHVNFWDPFIVGTIIPHQISFVAADSNFRSGLERFLLSFLFTIPKKKARTDMESLRTIMELVVSGRVVAIFPEGQRTWDGVTRDLLPGIEKLIRLLEVPVVTPILQGAYLTTPRWSPFHRRGPLVVRYDLLFTAEETRTLSTEEIGKRLRGALLHDEDRWQQETNYRYFSSRSAEYVEQAFFVCPACRSFNTIRSQGRNFRCNSCGTEAVISSTGRIRSIDGDLPIRTFHEWNRLQIAILGERVQRARVRGTKDVLAWIDEVDLMRGWGSRPLQRVATGRALLTTRHLLIQDDMIDLYRFPVSEIRAYHIQFSQDLEFYHGKTLYVVRPRSKRDSTYWFEQTLSVLHQLPED